MLNVQESVVNTKHISYFNSLNHNFKLRKSNTANKYVINGKQLDLIDDGIDLNEQFVETPEKTFLIRVKGDSMHGAGIDDGDILLVDSAKNPQHGSIVIASINNKLAVKKLHYSYKETMLISENDNYLPIRPKESDRLKIWGVAIMVIKDIV
ncbi:MAG: translesion error-prone DNA polymerase V autoproteolytic subunit [Candidatus Kapaibacterium sp.]|jgi:DNA polymerase V|nr:translesion error-prone DNA polymerase V autoproteolytic subunit [Candidatus Kapabacteria bacterium]